MKGSPMFSDGLILDFVNPSSFRDDAGLSNNLLICS